MNPPGTSEPPKDDQAPETDGQPDDNEADLPVLRSLREQDQKRRGLVATVVVAVVWLLARHVPGLRVLVIVLLLSFGLGAILGAFILRSRPTVRSVIAWSGLLTWLLPALGMLTSGAVWFGQDARVFLNRERILTMVAIVLSLGNAAVSLLAAG